MLQCTRGDQRNERIGLVCVRIFTRISRNACVLSVIAAADGAARPELSDSTGSGAPGSIARLQENIIKN